MKKIILTLSLILSCLINYNLANASQIEEASKLREQIGIIPKLLDCPSEINYSYPFGSAYTAYSTNEFDFSKVVENLLVSITFKNNSNYTLILEDPQVWTNKVAGDSDYHLPLHELVYDRTTVLSKEEFSLSGIVDIHSVPNTDRVLTFRPQADISRAWFGDVEKFAPIVDFSFVCLPTARKGKNNNMNLINGVY